MTAISIPSQVQLRFGSECRKPGYLTVASVALRLIILVLTRNSFIASLLGSVHSNMASLNKLAIRGIRSFDDKQISVIEFFSPVTVIVGHNGSGKTTIIECLKYATTGDQPPNTRGGAFIHDPKMANEKEVKAQVKLRFHAANGNRMLAVRNLSVTVKKTAGLTMKTLESILALADGNDKGGKVSQRSLTRT